MKNAALIINYKTPERNVFQIKRKCVKMIELTLEEIPTKKQKLQ